MIPYETELAAWRQQRLAALVAPDGWLSVVGLHWLNKGPNRLGSDEGNDLVVPQLPQRAGTVTLQANGEIVADLDPNAGATVDGQPIGQARLHSDADAAGPTLVGFGDVTLHVIARAGDKALRIRDANSPARLHFAAIKHFPVDPCWRIAAHWEPLETPRSFEIESMAGGSNIVSVSHKAVFEVGGQMLELLPTHGSATAPMFVLRDGTSGHQTYGACRFLVGEVQGDNVLLDFNKAINPPCAFTPFATCPLPPPANILPISSPVGELAPAGY